MVGVAQLVEHQVVALVAVGSSPIAHPIKNAKDHCSALQWSFSLWHRHPSRSCRLKQTSQTQRLQNQPVATVTI